MLLFHPPIHSQNCPVSEPPSVFHSFFSAKGKTDVRKDLRVCLVDYRTIKWSSISYSYQIKPTLEILSLLHWLTPLLTLTTHSTARFRACWTSSRAGTMVMLGMERVTLTLKMACWPLLLPQLGESLSATGGENSCSDTIWFKGQHFMSWVDITGNSQSHRPQFTIPDTADMENVVKQPCLFDTTSSQQLKDLFKRSTNYLLTGIWYAMHFAATLSIV